MARIEVLCNKGSEVAFRVFHDGRTPHDVWFRSSTDHLVLTPASVLAATLLVCMRTGEQLELPVAVPLLFPDTLDELQGIFHHWFPEQLNRIAITVDDLDNNAHTPLSQDTLLFFTGGVDSFFSVLSPALTVNRLVFVIGFDVMRHWPEMFLRDVLRHLRAAAMELHCPITEIETNLKEYALHFGVPWGPVFHGAALASVAHLLTHLGRRSVISSSSTYADSKPWGSHPLVDRLWSTAAMQISHYGADTGRLHKTLAVAQSDVAMKHLRVCFENTDFKYNCNHCGKCIRAKAALKVAGRLGACATLDHDLDLNAVARLPMLTVNQIARHWEFVSYLREVGGCDDIRVAFEDTLKHVDVTKVNWPSGWPAALSDIWRLR